MYKYVLALFLCITPVCSYSQEDAPPVDVKVGEFKVDINETGKTDEQFAKEYYFLGHKAYINQDYETAIKELTKTLHYKPNSKHTQVMLRKAAELDYITKYSPRLYYKQSPTTRFIETRPSKEYPNILVEVWNVGGEIQEVSVEGGYLLTKSVNIAYGDGRGPSSQIVNGKVTKGISGRYEYVFISLLRRTKEQIIAGNSNLTFKTIKIKPLQNLDEIPVVSNASGGYFELPVTIYTFEDVPGTISDPTWFQTEGNLKAYFKFYQVNTPMLTNMNISLGHKMIAPKFPNQDAL